MMTQGQALEAGCRAALKRWPKAGALPSWTWARTAPGRAAPWVVTVGDMRGPLVRVVIDSDGTTTVVLA